MKNEPGPSVPPAFTSPFRCKAKNSTPPNSTIATRSTTGKVIGMDHLFPALRGCRHSDYRVRQIANMSGLLLNVDGNFVGFLHEGFQEIGDGVDCFDPHRPRSIVKQPFVLTLNKIHVARDRLDREPPFTRHLRVADVVRPEATAIMICITFERRPSHYAKVQPFQGGVDRRYRFRKLVRSAVETPC